MHVTRAAEHLRLAQPALTQQIKALEAELHTPLLRRVGRGIQLTAAGTAFFKEAKEILARVRDAEIITQETARGHTGRLSIGLTETASFAAPVTSVLKGMRERWPNVEFALVQGRTDDLVSALTERRIDVAFGRSPAPTGGSLECLPFLTEEFFVAAPKGHRFAKQRVVDLSALADEPLIVPRGRATDEALRSRLLAAIAEFGKTPRIAQETPERVMAINLVAAGFGVALAPAVLTGLRRDAVVYRPLRSIQPLHTQLIIVTRRSDPSPIVDNFLSVANQFKREFTERDRKRRG
jgi:DNA-binding transcriptional LysR family regulator